MPIVEARLIIPVGTADDPAGKSGLANLTATLLDKGTKTKTDNELAEELEALGRLALRRRLGRLAPRSASRSSPGTSTPALALVGRS